MPRMGGLAFWRAGLLDWLVGLIPMKKGRLTRHKTVLCHLIKNVKSIC